MKKRTALLLALVLAFALLSPLAQAADLYFVAVNDTVPLTLSADSAPFYSGGDLYASRAVFSVSGLGITPSYNETGKTLTLFARSSRIVFYLDENRTVDETGAELALTTIRKNGVIYVPVAACAEHFGRSVSYLTSSDGYRVLRFTSGSQVYDDSLFMEKAANLIAYRASQYQSEQSSAATNPPNGQQQTEQNDQTQHDPATVYIAVTGAETMERTLLLLSARGIPAVFFFTEAEIKANAELVLAIRAAGYPIGLTASPNETSVEYGYKLFEPIYDYMENSGNFVAQEMPWEVMAWNGPEYSEYGYFYSDISTKISEILASDVDAHEAWHAFIEENSDKLQAVLDELNANLK